MRLKDSTKYSNKVIIGKIVHSGAIILANE